MSVLLLLVMTMFMVSLHYYPLLHPDLFFFFSCSFDLKVGLIDIVHPGKRQTLKSTESSKHLSLSVDVQIHCTSMLCGSEISKTMFPFFTALLFCHAFLLPFTVTWGLLPAPGSAQGNAVGSVLEVAAARQLSGVCGVMEHPGKTYVVRAYSGRDEVLVSPGAGPGSPILSLSAGPKSV